jgi:hypothetical protein
VREVQKVVAVTLDWLLDWFPPPQLVKLDVEGAELECLRGAGILLGRVQPVIFCETTAANSSEVGRLLTAAGYLLYDAAETPTARQPLTAPVWNTLAIPAARAPSGGTAGSAAGRGRAMGSPGPGGREER